MKRLFKDIYALVTEDGKPVVKRQNIAVNGSKIVNAETGFVPDETIDGSDRLLLPGLINAHTHSYMSVFRNYADDLTFDEWLFKRIMPKEDAMSPDDAAAGAMLACCEMLRTGTTCFLDMHMFPGIVAEAAQACGMRAVLSRGLAGDADDGANRRVREAADEMERYADSPLITFAVGPHAVYTCGEALLLRARDMAAERGLPLHIHLSETRHEVDECMSAHGCSPVAYLEKLGLFDVPTVAAHCVYADGRDIEILARHGVSAATCPISNLKLANGIAPLPAMSAAGINVCLGTDGAASNNALNMFREMGVCALIHKGATHDPLALGAQEVLRMATANGARALGFGDTLGVIRPGAAADLAVLDLKRPEFTPRNDLLTSLCYSANGGGVEQVYVNGVRVVDGGRLTLCDEDEILAKADAAAKRMGLAQS